MDVEEWAANGDDGPLHVTSELVDAVGGDPCSDDSP